MDKRSEGSRVQGFEDDKTQNRKPPRVREKHIVSDSAPRTLGPSNPALRFHSNPRTLGPSNPALYPVLLLVLLTLALGACRKQPPSAPPPPAVTVAQPVQRTVTDYLELTGNTQAIMTVQLVARVAGYLDKVLFKDGQVVKKNDLLFLIQQNTYEENLRQTEAAILSQKAQFEYAETELRRFSNLVKEKAASQTDVDNWRFQRDSAKANLLAAETKRNLAQLDLTYTEVRAPFDGRVDRRLVDPGNYVGSGQATVLALINRIDPIYVYFTISDLDLNRLMKEADWVPGNPRARAWPVFMGSTGDKAYPYEGQLDFASISLTPTTGTLLVRGIFPNPDGKILPGLYARVHVPVKERVALLVPPEAIAYDQRGAYLLTVDESNTVQRVTVKLGAESDSLRVVEEGLSGREWVVINGIQRAVTGRQVTPQRQDLTRRAGSS